MKPFSPDNLVPVADIRLDDLVKHLNEEFEKLIEDGWYTEWHKDRIYLSLKTDSDYGKNLVALRAEVETAYTDAGWSSATVTTSEEGGERPGLVSLRLVKKAEHEEKAVNCATIGNPANCSLLKKEVADIRASLLASDLPRHFKPQFDIICLSIENIGKIADSIGQTPFEVRQTIEQQLNDLGDVIKSKLIQFDLTEYTPDRPVLFTVKIGVRRDNMAIVYINGVVHVEIS